MPSDLRVLCGAVVAFDPLTWDNFPATQSGPGRGVGTSGRGLIDADRSAN